MSDDSSLRRLGPETENLSLLPVMRQNVGIKPLEEADLGQSTKGDIGFLLEF